MRQSTLVRVAATLAAGLFLAATGQAQATGMDHARHGASTAATASAPAGQDAFAALSAVIAALEADSTTDWSKVNIEALRQHLIDMDFVTMRSEVAQRVVPGGIQMDVTGTGRTLLAIRRMAVSHTNMLDQSAEYHATAAEIPGGARLTVTAKNAADTQMVARIRGLGFAGIMTEGDHHARHHLALARGDAMPHGR